MNNEESESESKPLKRTRSLGRRIFKTEAQLKKGIEKYFDDCDENKRHFQILGLYLSLGICRKTGENYLNGVQDNPKNNFSSILRRAKDWIELDKTEKALNNKVSIPMAIYDLKANHGRIEASRQEITGADGAELIPAINFNFHSDSKDSEDQ